MLPDNLGYLFDADFVGRKDDMINVAGENVYPKEVEDLLLRHANLRDACVVPAPHGVKGEVPVAFVVEREPGRTTEEEIKRFCLEHGGVPTIDLRVDYLRPARRGELVGIGRTLRVGRTVSVADVEIRDGSGSVVAVGRGVYASPKDTAPSGATAPPGSKGDPS